MAAEPLNFIDLYSGVGGFTLGFIDYSSFKDVRFRPRLLIDIDPEARQTFQRNLPTVRFSANDLSHLSGSEIRRLAGMSVEEEVHVLIGGPPCQGFSFLGKRSLEDERNACVLDFLRIVEELQPWVVVIENVPLIITSHKGAVINEIKDALSSFSYSCCADVLQASDFGVPQIRKRAFVVAYHNRLGITPTLPTRTHERIKFAADLSGSAAKPRFEESKKAFVSVEEAIGDLPPLTSGKGDDMMNYIAVPNSEYQRWARAGSPVIFNHKSRTHSPAFLDKISVIKEGGRNQDLPDSLRFSDNYYSQAYARLFRHGICGTITTHFANPGSGRFTHYNELRSITVREAARFQSFPDVFVFEGNLATQMRHVGNAVPPLMARAIRDQIARDLVGILPGAQPIESAAVVSKQRSDTMRAIPSTNTSVEILLRDALWEEGLTGYKQQGKRLPGTPDIYFESAKVAIFIDGCFWHGCPKCYRAPKTNSEYWTIKVTRNRQRDGSVNAQLEESGWKVVRVWEHQVKDDLKGCVRKVVKHLEKPVAKKRKNPRGRKAA